MKSLQVNTSWHSLFLSFKEKGILFLTLALGVVSILAPHINQFAHYHNFADQRTWLQIPCIMDVLSNLPFFLMGICGIVVLRRSILQEHRYASIRDMYLLFFYGLIMTGVCSSAYHLQANNQSLWLDRMGMSVAFAGMLGMAVANRISLRAGKAAVYTTLIVAPISLWVWQTTGNLAPWGVLQLGGMIIVFTLAFLKEVHGQPRLPLMYIILWYALAKILEIADHQVFALTGGWISGHSLKHIAASLAALPVICMLYRQRQSLQ